MTPCKFEDGKCIHCGEAKQGLCEGFVHSTESVQRKEIERLELEAVAWSVTVDNLQAELAELKQQEPIGWVFPDEDYSGSVIKPYADAPSLSPVYLAAGAQPVPEAKNITTAPDCLNMNDKAFWITGWNECRTAMLEAAKVKS